MPRKTVPTLELVAVLWLDAAYTFKEDVTEPVAPIYAVTVGRIVSMDRTQVKVAGECFADGEHRQVTSIPRGMVRRVIPLKSVRLPEWVA